MKNFYCKNSQKKNFLNNIIKDFFIYFFLKDS
jgi:hypothetical protein